MTWNGVVEVPAMWYRRALKIMNVNTNAFERMAASGMGRLLRHMMSGPFAILSADRIGMTPQDKDLARRKLKDQIRGLGFGFADTTGAWREDSGEYSHEGSIFVPGITPDVADALGREFGQEAVIVGDRGKYGFMDTQGESMPPSYDFDLSNTLDVPSLTAQPDMFTQIGRRKFELITDPEDPRGPIRFSPEEIASRRKRYESLADLESVPAVGEHAFLAHAYIGHPPPQMLRAAMRSIDSPTPGVGGMAFCVPFVATVVEVLPEFSPSPYWGQVPMNRSAAGPAVAPFVQPPAVDSTPYERALADAAQFHGDVDDLFMQRKPGSNMKSLDSLYVGRNGEYFLLRPHSHDEVAREVLRTVDPNLPAVKRKGWPSGGYTHHDLGRASGGIMRTQFYPDGMGVTIDMNSPPNRAQLDAIRRGYRNTPMERFVAEITLDGKILAHLTSFGQLVHLVNSFDPNHPEDIDVLDPKLGELFDRRLSE